MSPDAVNPNSHESRSQIAASSDVLLVVALKTDQPNIERRLKMILAGAEPFDVDTEACVYAKPVDDLVAADLDALAALIGWDAVSRLRVGDVVSVGLSTSPDGARGERSDAGLSDTDSPIYEDCEFHPGQISYPDSGCSRCNEETFRG